MVGLSAIALIAFLWLTRGPRDNIIPVEYRGIWLDKGAECHDTNARTVITGTTIDYDHLTFKADGLSEREGDTASVTGAAFPNGREARETVKLQMRDSRSVVFIARPDRTLGPFTRCAADAT